MVDSVVIAHRAAEPIQVTLERTGELPLEFTGWRVIQTVTRRRKSWDNSDVSSGDVTLSLWETVGGSWVARHTVHAGHGPDQHVTTVHRSRDDAVAVMGFGPHALAVREALGYPMVERVA